MQDRIENLPLVFRILRSVGQLITGDKIQPSSSKEDSLVLPAETLRVGFAPPAFSMVFSKTEELGSIRL